jgi:hypothetical protein
MLIPGFKQYEMDAEYPHDVTHIASGRVRQWILNRYGYYQISIYKEGRKHTICRGRLIAQCFIPNTEGKLTVDHINRDRTDDRVANLRWATHAEQTANRVYVHRNNTSGVRGVSWHKPTAKWQVKIMVDGTNIHLGYFDDIHDAEACYLSKRRELGRE